MTDHDAYPALLQESLTTTFNRAELADLCLRLGVNFDSLPDAGLAVQARELILLLARQQRLPELLAVARAERPTVDWPPVPSGFRPPAAVPAPAAAPAPTSEGITVGSVNATYAIVGNDGVMNISHEQRDEPPDDLPAPLRHVRSTLRQTQQAIENLPAADGARADLIRLVGKLEKALWETPPGKLEQAAEVADVAKGLVNAAGVAKPRKAVVRGHGDALLEAAGALADDLPAVVDIANKIVAAVAGMV